MRGPGTQEALEMLKVQEMQETAVEAETQQFGKQEHRERTLNEHSGNKDTENPTNAETEQLKQYERENTSANDTDNKVLYQK